MSAAYPEGLGDAGRALWDAVHDDLEPRDESEAGWELDAREQLVLEAAARQADLNRGLEAAIDRDGLTVAGWAGQPRLNPAATELRQGRIALQKLLAELALPNESGQAVTSAQRRAKAAAEARWGRRSAG